MLMARVVACALFAACGGEKRRRSEDTSRSGKGLAPSALPLLLTLSMSEKRTITLDNTHPPSPTSITN